MEGTKSLLNKVYVGGIPAEASEKEVREHFGKFGALTDIVLIKDKHTKKSRGFGFVTFKDSKSVRRILKEHLYLRGKLLEVKIAEPKKASKLLEIKDTSTITKVFIGGVPKEATVEDLVRYFSSFGRIREASIIEDKKTNEPRGFGFVSFEEVDSVRKVIDGYSSHSIFGKWVECKIALPKSSGEKPSVNGESDSNSLESGDSGLQQPQEQKTLRGLGIAVKNPNSISGRDSYFNNQLKINEVWSGRCEPEPRLSTKELGKTTDVSVPSRSSHVLRTPLLSQDRITCSKPRFLPIFSDESNYSFRQACEPILSYRTVRTVQSAFGAATAVLLSNKIYLSTEAIQQTKQVSCMQSFQRHLNSESQKQAQLQRAKGMSKQAFSSLSRCQAPLLFDAPKANANMPPQSDDMWRTEPDQTDLGLHKYEGFSSNHSDEPSPVRLEGGRWQEEQNAPDLTAPDWNRACEQQQYQETGPTSISINSNLEAHQSYRSRTESNSELENLAEEGTKKSCRIEEAANCKFFKDTDHRELFGVASKQIQKQNSNLNGVSYISDPKKNTRAYPNHETSYNLNRSGFRAGAGLPQKYKISSCRDNVTLKHN